MDPAVAMAMVLYIAVIGLACCLLLAVLVFTVRWFFAFLDSGWFPDRTPAPELRIHNPDGKPVPIWRPVRDVGGRA